VSCLACHFSDQVRKNHEDPLRPIYSQAMISSSSSAVSFLIGGSQPQLRWSDRSSIDDKYPNGWPRVAAFLESCDSFSIYRRFGHAHSRLLVTHQCNITDLETQLQYLDKSDDEGGPDTQFRLKTRYHEEGFDTTKRDLEEKLEKELLAYGTLP